jgi:hypothetical protein
LLASLARLVNDATSDAARHRLAAMIPDVIGLTSDNPRVDVRIALRSATAALPVASSRRQSAMAAAVVAGNRLLAQLGGGDDDDVAGVGGLGRLEEESRWALAHAPAAARWAEQFADDCPPTVTGFRRFGAPLVVRTAVEGIAHACIPEPDRLLHDLLRATISDCTAWIGAARPTPAVVAPAGRVRDRRRRVGLSRR